MSLSRLTFSHDTIPPTPPPRSRPHSRSSCRGGSLKRNDAPPPLNNDKRKPPLAPPRSPVVKEKKFRKKIRDDDIKGILESVIARVSETDLTRLYEGGNKDPENLCQDEEAGIHNNQQEIIDSLYARPVKSQRKEFVCVSTPKEESEDGTQSCEIQKESSGENIENTETNAKTDRENLNNSKDEAGNSQTKHEVMKANNARMDCLWNNIKHASNLSLNKVPMNNK